MDPVNVQAILETGAKDLAYLRGDPESEFDENEDYGDELTIRAKWSIDGATTLGEAAVMLRKFALWLERTEGEGWELTGPIQDDYGFCRKTTSRTRACT